MKLFHFAFFFQRLLSTNRSGLWLFSLSRTCGRAPGSPRGPRLRTTARFYLGWTRLTIPLDIRIEIDAGEFNRMNEEVRYAGTERAVSSKAIHVCSPPPRHIKADMREIRTEVDIVAQFGHMRVLDPYSLHPSAWRVDPDVSLCMLTRMGSSPPHCGEEPVERCLWNQKASSGLWDRSGTIEYGSGTRAIIYCSVHEFMKIRSSFVIEILIYSSLLGTRSMHAPAELCSGEPRREYFRSIQFKVTRSVPHSDPG